MQSSLLEYINKEDYLREALLVFSNDDEFINKISLIVDNEETIIMMDVHDFKTAASKVFCQGKDFYFHNIIIDYEYMKKEMIDENLCNEEKEDYEGRLRCLFRAQRLKRLFIISNEENISYTEAEKKILLNIYGEYFLESIILKKPIKIEDIIQVVRLRKKEILFRKAQDLSAIAVSNLGVRGLTRGYPYLCDAVSYYIASDKKWGYKRILNSVASRHQMSPSKIERSMFEAAQRGFNNKDRYSQNAWYIATGTNIDQVMSKRRSRPSYPGHLIRRNPRVIPDRKVLQFIHAAGNYISICIEDEKKRCDNIKD